MLLPHFKVAEIGVVDCELGHHPHVEGRCGGVVAGAHALDRDRTEPYFWAFDAHHGE